VAANELTMKCEKLLKKAKKNGWKYDASAGRTVYRYKIEYDRWALVIKINKNRFSCLEG
jgi:hypothetical protein